MSAESTRITLSCPQCRAELDPATAPPGSWLLCPACGTPVLVPRPTAASARTGAAGRGSPSETVPIPRMPRGEGAAGSRFSAPAMLGAGVLAGFALTAYVASYLGYRNGADLSVSWAFGFMLAEAAILLHGVLAGGPPRGGRV